MAEERQKSKTGSTQKVLVFLAILLLLVGGAVIDPLAGVACFILSGIVSLIALFMGPGWPRYMAVTLLIAAMALTVSNYSDARQHQQSYKSQAASSSAE